MWHSPFLPPPSAPSCSLPAATMGCGLRKLEDPDDSSPGKIFSTLKRPQVETKTDSAYEYILLDFTLEGRYLVSAVLCVKGLNGQKFSLFYFFRLHMGKLIHKNLSTPVTVIH